MTLLNPRSLDHNDFRVRLRRCREALPGVEVVFPAQGLTRTDVARSAVEAGAGISVRSADELATALAAGVIHERIVSHGAAERGVGRVVVGSGADVARLSREASEHQRVLLRVTPGTDGHELTALTEDVLRQPMLNLVGLYCAAGSPAADPVVLGETIHTMVSMLADVRAAHGVTLMELSIGGVGFLAGLADLLDDALDAACAAERFPRPRIVVELDPAVTRAWV